MRRAALHVFNTTGEIHLSEVRSTPSHISEQYKLHMCTIPKIASTELAALILRIESVPRNQLKTFFPTDKDRVNYMWPYSKGPFLRAKSTSEKLDILSDRSWLNVAFVRNPYTRVLSGWKQKILHPTDSIHHAIKCAYPGMPFEEFISCLESLREANREGVLMADDHFRPQYQLCGFNAFNYDVIARIEYLERDLRCIAQDRGFEAALEFGWGPGGNYSLFNMPRPHPTGDSKPIREYFSKDLQDRVYDLYKTDFELLRYSYELPE
mmetsp:Transcript_7197/g.12968  ORF Transcript_7197/g.12968 Transcript_7197/m.12968 type:complete len:266 (-) Transcript_7197:869-1666(-)